MSLLFARISGFLLLAALALFFEAPARAGGEDGVAFIAADELRAQQSTPRRITLVDVRTGEEFQESRIKGAVNVPLTELELRFKEIPRQGLVVLY